ncbi:MAG: RnfABCDGE type electron transport complex subunit G [Bacteroidales bacterium]|nr:RnfABCDGE type electron transport complex subunit G [Bacteroidales bacterium]
MAKKAESTLINMLLSLTIIAVVAGAVLALVSGVTADPIAKAEQAKTENAIKAVLPEFDHLETKDIDGVACNMAYTADNSLVGIAVPATSKKGFGGDLGIMFGFDAEGNISGYQVLKTAETPGLGAKASEWFQKGGKGDVVGKNPNANNLTVSKDGGEVDAISGSTITSRAFCDAIAIAYELYKKGVNE